MRRSVGLRKSALDLFSQAAAATERHFALQRTPLETSSEPRANVENTGGRTRTSSSLARDARPASTKGEL